MDTVNQRVVGDGSHRKHPLYVRPARLHQRGRLQLAPRRGCRSDQQQPLDRRYQAERHPDPAATTRVAPLSTQFGVAGARRAPTFNYPYSIAINHSDNIAWIADTRNNRIELYNVATQTLIATYGSLGSGTGQFNSPSGIGIDQANGNILVADTNNKRIVELSDTNGSSITQVATFTTAGGAAFNHPTALRVTLPATSPSRPQQQSVEILNPDGSLGAVITAATSPEAVQRRSSTPRTSPLGRTATSTSPIRTTTASSSTPSRPTPVRITSCTHLFQHPCGPGSLRCIPVDASNSSQYYFILDAGNYRVLAVNRTTHNIDCTVGGSRAHCPESSVTRERSGSIPRTTNYLWRIRRTTASKVFSFNASACGRERAYSSTCPSSERRVPDHGEFNNAYGVAVDSVNQWVYVTDGSGWVEKFSITGQLHEHVRQGNAQ